ncbi:hypothetical protein HNY73_009766 [Argiope bruennichi]|uniref:Uncharacterized protein n=1 Tax=Argiope bruennichi TaxID=94029 RepID=A0A8T0FAN5_ARGBR|nr:hypothetical protein HNY73_009766 [Argiope bruennichi]
MKTLVFLLLVLTQWTRAAPVKDDGDSSLMYRCNCGSPVQPIPPAVIPVPHPSHIDIPPNWHPGPFFLVSPSTQFASDSTSACNCSCSATASTSACNCSCSATASTSASTSTSTPTPTQSD